MTSRASSMKTQPNGPSNNWEPSVITATMNANQMRFLVNCGMASNGRILAANVASFGSEGKIRFQKFSEILLASVAARILYYALFLREYLCDVLKASKPGNPPPSASRSRRAEKCCALAPVQRSRPQAQPARTALGPSDRRVSHQTKPAFQPLSCLTTFNHPLANASNQRPSIPQTPHAHDSSRQRLPHAPLETLPLCLRRG